MIVHIPHGKLAHEYCGVKLPLQVLQSAAGFYLGTIDPNEGPVSRESEEYFPSQKAAEAAMTSGEWTQRHQP